MDGYAFGKDKLAELLIMKSFPERTQHETAIIIDHLREHGDSYDRFAFSVRVGKGTPPNPEHLPGVQRSTSWSTRQRIDALFYRGAQPIIAEVKKRVIPEVLGQLLTYRQLFLEEFPESPVPELIALGRESTEDVLRVLQDHGITTYLYAATDSQ